MTRLPLQPTALRAFAIGTLVLLLAASLDVQHVSAQSGSDSCASGAAVAEPADSPELISDC